MERKKKNQTGRLAFRIIAALGIALGAAAVWYEYSEQLITKFLGGFGLG